MMWVGLVAAMASAPMAVQAADMPVKAPPLPAPVPVYSWTGCYIGGNIGGARVSVSCTTLLPEHEWGRTGDGVFMGGGQIGCNYQFNSFCYRRRI